MPSVLVTGASRGIGRATALPYNASKFAIEAIADVVRLELAPWGIRVVPVLPAQTDTDMWRTADDTDNRTATRPVHRGTAPRAQVAISSSR